jgi:WD40 repeat protein
VVGEVVLRDLAKLQRAEPLSFGTNHCVLDLSRDGHWLALSDLIGNIQVWDFPARRQVAKLVFPDVRMIGVQFSPRGHYLGFAAYDSGNRVVDKWWETATWREVNQEGINRKLYRDIAFSADERTLAIGHDDGTADWWDLRTRKRLAFFDGHHADSIRPRFSPDGRYFAMAGMRGGRMMLCEVATREERPMGRDYRSGVSDLFFSPDSRRLLTAGNSPKDVLKIWDVETGRDVATLPGEPGLFYNRIGFSPDGNTLFAISLEGKALFWHAPSWEEIGTKEKANRTP